MAPLANILPDLVDTPISMTTRQSLDKQLKDILTVIELYRNEVDDMRKQRSDDSGLNDLSNSLKEFHSFSREYYRFVSSHAPSKLTAGAQALQKIQHELLTLRPLIDQRHSSTLSPQLRMADALASSLIQQCYKDIGIQWTSQGFDKPDICLTFFEETHSIRLARYAYYRVPSVSIPLADWNKPWMWMGLAHELGHYVYHNVKELAIDNLDLAEYIQQNIFKKILVDSFDNSGVKISKTIASFQLWSEWIEEIFADVYGALILGPSYIYSLIQWLRERLDTLEALLTNDHDHPIGLLRPLIQIEALRVLYNDTRFSDSDEIVLTELTNLEAQWIKFCEERATKRSTFEELLNNIIGGTEIKAALCYTQIQKVAKILVDLLIDLKSPASIIFYQPGVHRQVRQVAAQLVGGDMDAQLDSLPVIFYLPIALYAARMQPTAKNEKNIRKWLKNIVYQPNQSARNSVYGNSPEPPAPGDSFKRLVSVLKTELETDDNKLVAVRLLALEFSAREGLGGCPVGQSCQNNNF